MGAVLNNAILAGANMQKANLSEALIEKSGLQRANLQEADLWGASMNGSHLDNTDLRKASLVGTDLRETNLYRAKFQGAVLVLADLRGVNLEPIENMYDAVLCEGEACVLFDENTILPYGCKWTPDTDMTPFVNPPDWVRNVKVVTFAVPDGNKDEAIKRVMQRLLDEGNQTKDYQ